MILLQSARHTVTLTRTSPTGPGRPGQARHRSPAPVKLRAQYSGCWPSGYRPLTLTRTIPGPPSDLTQLNLNLVWAGGTDPAHRRRCLARAARRQVPPPPQTGSLCGRLAAADGTVCSSPRLRPPATDPCRLRSSGRGRCRTPVAVSACAASSPRGPCLSPPTNPFPRPPGPARARIARKG